MWSATAVLVGSTIGSGIFRVPSTVAAEVGSTGAIAAVWVAGAVISLLGALTLAELATALPASGGIYVYLREAYGRGTAFLFGWTQLVVIRPSALGAISLIFAQYLGVFVHLGDGGVRVAAALAIVAIGLLNMRSVLWGAWIGNGTTAAKVAALTVLGGALLVYAATSPAPAAAASPPEALRLGGFVLALVAALWAYDGWADLTFMAGEVRDPGRTLPRALALGVSVVVVLYLLLNAAFLSVLPVADMAASELVAADATARAAGPAGERVVAALVVLATLGALNGAMMTGPRIFFAMARDGLMWRPIASVHPRWSTPWAAVALATTLGVAYVSVRSFEELAGSFVLGIWPFYALAVGAVVLLRRRRPDLPRPYRTPGYPWVPAVFLVAAVGMLAVAAVQAPSLALLGATLIGAGVPVYLVIRRRGERRSGA